MRQCTARYGGGILNAGEFAAACMRIVESTIADHQTDAAGCGGKLPDETRGADGTTDVVVK